MEIANKEKNRRFSRGFLLVVVFLLAVYFIITRAVDFLVFTEASYGPYFWPRVNWVFPHVVCGIIAILIGPFQFSNKLRANYILLHRRSGYVYLSAVLIGAIAGGTLAATSEVNLTYQWGLMGLAIAWLLTSGMAFFFILKRKVAQHKEWMVRSYVVTFAFVIFRIVADILEYYQIGENTDRLTLMSWACWALPLLFVEPILQYRRTFKRKKS